MLSITIILACIIANAVLLFIILSRMCFEFGMWSEIKKFREIYCDRLKRVPKYQPCIQQLFMVWNRLISLCCMVGPFLCIDWCHVPELPFWRWFRPPTGPWACALEPLQLVSDAFVGLVAGAIIAFHVVRSKRTMGHRRLLMFQSLES